MPLRGGGAGSAEGEAGGRPLGAARVVARALATITPQRGQAASVTAAWPQRGQSMGGFMGAHGNSRDEVPSMTVRAVEATAPTRIDLAGGTLDIWPLYLFHPGAVTVNAAIDRRAWCRVETGHEGVRIESKDTLRKAEGRNVSEVLGGGELSLVANILRALDIETGVKVITQSRVPSGSGLGGSSALSVAVAAALRAAFDR
jgi:hypothetical protein